jgi:hypothetical protein
VKDQKLNWAAGYLFSVAGTGGKAFGIEKLAEGLGSVMIYCFCFDGSVFETCWVSR